MIFSDGQKMSKRLKNYPDPVAVVKKYGADALRLYLINSPVVRAESLRFKEVGVKDVVKDVFLPWFNAYRFLMQNVARLKEVCTRSNVLVKSKRWNLLLYHEVGCLPIEESRNMLCRLFCTC